MSTVPKSEIGPIRRIRFLRHWARSHDKRYGAAVLAFPRTLGRQRRKPLDQEDTNFCTAYGEAVSNGYEQECDFSGAFQTAAESEYLGAPIMQGADPYPSMQATYIMGSLPADLSPFELNKDGAVFIANWRNWPSELFRYAKRYKTPLVPYYVDGPYDTFDNIRNALYQAFLANETGVVKAFGYWFESWNVQAMNRALRGVLRLPDPLEQPVSRHRYTFIDFDEKDGRPVLVAAMTQGEGYGDGGFVYMDRETVNWAYKAEIANGLGLYIARKPASSLSAFFAWVRGIATYLAARVNLLANSQA
jgi:hypothetical protein